MIKTTADISEIPVFASMWNMDGLILMGFCEADYEKLRNQMRISFVVYDGYFEKCSKVVNLVINHYDGGYQAGKYFKELGHKKALCIADNFICMDKERKEKTARVQDAEADGIIEGRNAVIEALRAGTTIDKIFIQKGETDKTLGHIASTARAAGVVVVDADKRKLDFMSRTHAHQGVIALTSVREYVSVEDILNIAREKGENPLIVVCDEISDPHNLGAIIRTAECAGAHGVVIPKRRSAGLTSIVAKTSAGAVSYVPVARVPNIPALLEQLQKEGVWVFGTAAEGTSDLYSADLKGPAAIVIGSEGDGMTRLVREKCDFLVSIPMKGKISSLNASAAASILLYEAVRQRLGQ